MLDIDLHHVRANSRSNGPAPVPDHEVSAMCHSDTSSPPPAKGAVAAASAAEVTLRNAEGIDLLAFHARPRKPTGVGIVVLPDVRGLHQFYKELAVRFAETGAEAVAIDYFARTAEDPDRAEGFDFAPHVQQTTPEGIAADVHAAVDHLREAGVRSVFTVGFCFGGSYSWRQSADTPGLAGAIGFYGRPERTEDAVDGMRAPLLMLVAGADANIRVGDVEQLARRARAAGVAADLHVFDDAPHSFFDRRAAEHAQACARAWDLVRAFIHDHA